MDQVGGAIGGTLGLIVAIILIVLAIALCIAWIILPFTISSKLGSINEEICRAELSQKKRDEIAELQLQDMNRRLERLEKYAERADVLFQAIEKNTANGYGKPPELPENIPPQVPP